jgi:hypothetical protein
LGDFLAARRSRGNEDHLFARTAPLHRSSVIETAVGKGFITCSATTGPSDRRFCKAKDCDNAANHESRVAGLVGFVKPRLPLLVLRPAAIIKKRHSSVDWARMTEMAKHLNRGQ